VDLHLAAVAEEGQADIALKGTLSSMNALVLF
jgi:hypothetical protein